MPPYRVHRLTIALGLALIAAAALWHFRLAAHWTQRIRPGWSTLTRYTGDQTFADPRTGLIPERDELVEYERLIKVRSEAKRPHSVLVEDRLTTRDVRTHEVIWEYVTRAELDPRTGAHVAPEHAGEIMLFPRNVERRTYVVTSNYLQRIPLAFERTDDTDGLETYVFAYRGPAEYTASYLGSGEFAGVVVPLGQEIRCADDQFYYRVWVERLTGAHVRVEEGCPSGDYLYDRATGERRAAVDRWSGTSTGDALLRRTAEVHALRAEYLRMERGVPVALLTAGLVLLAVGIRGVVGTARRGQRA